MPDFVIHFTPDSVVDIPLVVNALTSPDEEEVEEVEEAVAECVGCRNSMRESDVALTEPWGSRQYCISCITICAVCSESTPTTGATTVRNSRLQSLYICPECVRYCDNCDRAMVYHYENSDFTGDSCSGCDTSLCGRCMENHECNDNDNSDDDDAYGIHEYSYKPEAVFHGTDPDKLYLGLELEVDGDKYSLMERFNAYDKGLFYAKHDSSISGVEFVTHPMSREYAHNEFPYALLNSLSKAGNATDDDGIHIHLSRDAFSSYHMWKFSTFHYANPAFIRAIAGRDSQQWAPLHSTNTASGPSIDGEHLWRLSRNKRGSNARRYAAINFCNKRTIELRYFSSTLNPDRLKAYFQWIDATYQFTDIATVNKKSKPNAPRVTGVAFRRWLKNSKGFIELKNYIFNELNYTK